MHYSYLILNYSNIIVCRPTFYVHLWPCESLASTHFLWRPYTSFLGLHIWCG